MDKTIRDFKIELKKRQLENKLKDGVKKAEVWLRDNYQWFIPAVTIVVPGATSLIKFVAKRSNLKKQQDIKELYCYDNRLGHYWALKRELTNKEWIEIERRKKDGETLADILSNLKVLK